jgi:cation diffusion facilitator family transporter
MDSDNYYNISRKVSLVSIVVDALLSLFKIFFGLIGKSQVIFLDGIHSLSDLVTDLATFFVLKVANQPPDEDHPYGHGKIETIATLMISVALFIVVFFLFKDSISKIISPTKELPERFTIWIAILSIIVKEILYRYTLIKGKQIKSELLIANAHHHRSDALSSVAALIGLLLIIYTPFKYGEIIASFVVILMILHTAYEIGKEAFMELIDTIVDLPEKEDISQKILSINGIETFHHFRIIKSGVFYKVEIDIEVDPNMRLYDAHELSKKVKELIQKELKNTIHVIVHVDPYDPEKEH